ncbi:MAG: chorismate-binding protein [Thermogladius sp.]|uniref:Chromatin protein Cren7 n=1 Tax=Thermogladius calderae TaxID=1200300 RepID=A0A7J3XYQ1_9CREN|nr:chorismate-binding protein [Thermogladius sp.]
MAAREPCKKAIKVKTPSGKELELIPRKVWQLNPSGRKGVKVGLFQDPETGKFFRQKVPDDYPLCG